MGDEKKAKVFIANMANRITFKAADEDSAKIAADTIGKRKVNYILDADIRSFFDSVSQEWLVRFVEHRIGDKRIILNPAVDVTISA